MHHWLSSFRDDLKDIYPDQEIRSLYRMAVEAVTGKSQSGLILDPDMGLSVDQEGRMFSILERLRQCEPIQYILGETEFYGIRLKVGPGVLIPRGETEEMVEYILKTEGRRTEGQEGKEEGNKADREKGSDREVRRLLDMGCGSGAIAIILAKNLPDYEVFACDISETALQFTRENADMAGVSLTPFNFDILNPSSFPSCLPAFLPSALFDVIVSNPPYVTPADASRMQKNVLDFEPHLALFPSGEDPLVFYRAIAGFAESYLKADGSVFVEINENAGEETVAIFRDKFEIVELRRDIHGKDRIIRAAHGKKTSAHQGHGPLFPEGIQ